MNFGSAVNSANPMMNQNPMMNANPVSPLNAPLGGSLTSANVPQGTTGMPPQIMAAVQGL